jgi:hypothetical protein
MTDLIKRLESAEAGSRELNLRVMAHLQPQYELEERGADELYLWDGGECVAGMDTADPVTTDLSAAVALVERVLPDCNWQVHKHGFAGISLKGHGGMYVGVSSDCVLSLCLALFQALKAKEEV